MKRTVIMLTTTVVVFVCCLVSATYPQMSDENSRGGIRNVNPAEHKLDLISIGFTKNLGQWPDTILYRVREGRTTIWFTDHSIYYQITRRSDVSNAQNGSCSDLRPAVIKDNYVLQSTVVRAAFVGSNPDPEVSCSGETDVRCNFLFGSDPAEWQTNVPSYASVTIADIYQGIDLRYSVNSNGRVVYEYIASPGADLGMIRVEYDDAPDQWLDTDGHLNVETEWGLVLKGISTPQTGEPLSPQELCSYADGERETKGMVRTQLSTPVQLSYSTLLGEPYQDFAYAVVADDSGCAYITGLTQSSSFPTVNAFESQYQGNSDAFVVKLSAEGDDLLYATYLGGDDTDQGNGICVDSLGLATITGFTQSDDFPIFNAIQYYQGNKDVFVTRLSAGGDTAVFSTYLGGTYDEAAEDIVHDDSGATYITGYTTSSDFPVRNTSGTYQGSEDGFVVKIAADQDTLAYSTFVGGSDDDHPYGIAVDGDLSVYIAGVTASTNYPTSGAYQSNQAYDDAFVTKLSTDSDSILYSTYLGGSGVDEAMGIVVDGSGNAYVAGYTSSTDYPTENPYQTDQDNNTLDAFVTKLSTSGSSLVYSTYLGGSDGEYCLDIGVDDYDCAYVVGITLSSNFPLVDPFQQFVQDDAFVTKFTPDGGDLIYSSCLGGEGTDWPWAIEVDDYGNVYLTGQTDSFDDFPVLNPYQAEDGSIFVTKLAGGVGSCCGLYTSGFTGNCDCSTDGARNLADLTRLIDRVYLTKHLLCCEAEGNVDGDANGSINLADITRLSDHIYGSKAQTAACQ